MMISIIYYFDNKFIGARLLKVCTVNQIFSQKEINIFGAAVDLRDAFHITDTIFK